MGPSAVNAKRRRLKPDEGTRAAAFVGIAVGGGSVIVSTAVGTTTFWVTVTITGSGVLTLGAVVDRMPRTAVGETSTSGTASRSKMLQDGRSSNRNTQVSKCFITLTPSKSNQRASAEISLTRTCVLCYNAVKFHVFVIGANNLVPFVTSAL